MNNNYTSTDVRNESINIINVNNNSDLNNITDKDFLVNNYYLCWKVEWSRFY